MDRWMGIYRVGFLGACIAVGLDLGFPGPNDERFVVVVGSGFPRFSL